MAAYFVAMIEVHDAETYAEYGKRFYGIFDKYNGKVLAIDNDVEVLEGEWPAKRTVIIEFPSADDLKVWYDAPEYQELVALRASASTGNVVLVRGS